MPSFPLRGIVFGTTSLGIIPAVHAHCPLCTLAVGAGAATAYYFGLNIVAVGTFVGGAGIIMGLMFANMIRKKIIPFQNKIIIGGTFILTVLALSTLPSDVWMVPIRLVGESGGLFNKIYWLEKAYAGAAVGGITALVAHGLHKHIRKRLGRSIIPFQGIIITVGSIVLAAGVLHWVIA